LIGYDVVNVNNKKSFIFARKIGEVFGSDWLIFEPLIYTFSKKEIKKANQVLKNSVKNSEFVTLIIIDEYGRLETKGMGIIQGFNAVINTNENNVVPLIICRSDKINELNELLKDKVKKIIVLKGNPN